MASRHIQKCGKGRLTTIPRHCRKPGMPQREGPDGVRGAQGRARVVRPTVTETSLVPLERVERTILILRGQRVILDSDLAALCGVPVKRLNDRQIGFVGKGAGKVTDKPKSAPPVRP